MKKNLKLLLLSMFVFVPVVVFANEEYVNYYGIEINEEEYSNLLGLGFTEEEIHHMEQGEFDANKNIDSSLEAVANKYYVETIQYDSTGRVVHDTTTEVTEQEYNDGGVMLLDASAYIETAYKKLSTTISQAGSLYRYKVTLTWKKMPKVRSYDIIGIGIEPSLVTIVNGLVFNQTHCISNSCTNSNTYNSNSFTLTGAGVSFKLPTSTSITGLRSYLYFDVIKQDNVETLTAMFADGDYAHATRSVTSGEGSRFYVNQVGISLFDSIVDYYDTIPAAEAEWTGSW